MKILLLYQRAHGKELREYLTTQHQKEDLLVILEVNTHVDPPLIRNNIVTKRFEDYISDQELLIMDQDILYFANEWYKLEGKDITWYDNFSYGKATVYDFMVFFKTLLTGVTYAFRATSREQPEKCLLFFDQSFLQEIFTYILTTYFPSVQIEYLETSERHTDFTERQNPQLYSFPDQAESDKKNPEYQPRWPFLARLQQRLLIEVDAVIRSFDFQKRRRRTIFLRDLVASYDTLDTRLRKNPRNRILRNIIYAKSDFKHFARHQRRIKVELEKHWLQLKDNEQFRQFFYYVPEHPGFQKRFQISEQSLISTDLNRYQICDLWKIVRPHIENFFLKYMPFLSEQTKLFHRWAKRERLSLIAVNRVFGTSLCRLWLMTACQLGIPTVAMFDGTFYQSLPNRENHVEPLSDYIAVWGNAGVKTALSRGFTEQQIRIIEAYHLKELKKQAEKIDFRAWRKEWGIPDHKKIITLTPTTGSQLSSMPTASMLDQEDALKAICVASQPLKEYHFIIKFHPRNDLFEGKGSLARKIAIVESYHLENMTMISSQESIVYSMGAADLVITLGGSTGLDAIYLGKSLLFLNFNNRGQFEVDFVSGRAAIGVYRAEDLSKIIQEVLTSIELQEKMQQGRKGFLQRHISEVPDYDKIIANLASN